MCAKNAFGGGWLKNDKRQKPLHKVNWGISAHSSVSVNGRTFDGSGRKQEYRFALWPLLRLPFCMFFFHNFYFWWLKNYKLKCLFLNICKLPWPWKWPGFSRRNLDTGLNHRSLLNFILRYYQMFMCGLVTPIANRNSGTINTFILLSHCCAPWAFASICVLYWNWNFARCSPF